MAAWGEKRQPWRPISEDRDAADAAQDVARDIAAEIRQAGYGSADAAGMSDVTWAGFARDAGRRVPSVRTRAVVVELLAWTDKVAEVRARCEG
jgi:hypothetical protein